MKRCTVFLLLVLLVSCAKEVPPVVQEVKEAPFVEPVAEPVAVAPRRMPSLPASNVLIARDLRPYNFVSMDAGFDQFGIVPAERYDAKYSVASVDVNATVFSFGTRGQLEYVLDAVFDDVLRFGAQKYGTDIIMAFLTKENHRVAAWSRDDKLIYIDTSIPDFAAQEVVDAYLNLYPSDLLPKNCIDTDARDHFAKGFTTLVQFGSRTQTWTDVCMRDLPGYVSKKGLTQADGLLEGQCATTDFGPGFVEEYACAKGCQDGKCALK